MKFFYAPGTIAMASLIALCEANAKFKPIRLNFYEKEQTKPEYLSINPKGRVPALVTDEGIITETPAVLTYVAHTHPEANLIPNDPFKCAKMNEILCYLASTVHVNHAHKMRGHRWANKIGSFEDMTAKVAANMAENFNLIEEILQQGPWVLGDEYSLADIHLYVLTSWLEGDGVPLNTVPNVKAHFAAMNDRAAVQKALEIAG